MIALLLKTVFFWIPKTINWIVFFTPLAIVYACYEFIGPEFATVSVAGATLFLFKTMLSPKNDYRTALSSQVLTTPGTKKKESKRVAIIGAGPAGLVTAKECLQAGCKVTTYDSAPEVGGEFANRFWPGGKLTSSPYVTCFSDFEPIRNKNGSWNLLHDTKEEYTEYLRAYSTHFKVDQTLKLEQAVTKIAMKKLIDEEPTYNITVKTWKNGKEETRTDGPFDHVAFCIGGNRTPHVPNVKGLEEFKQAGGEVIHSADLGCKNSVDKAFEWCAGKRVVGLGMGESMADIYGIMLDEIKNKPKDVFVAIRSGSWVIPRVNPLNGIVNDWDSTRLRYAMPKWAHQKIVYFCGWMSHVFRIKENKESTLRWNLIKSCPNGKAVYKPATKSNRFISCIAQGKAELIHGGVKKIEGKTIYFTDGSVVKDVDSILFGTGFKKYNPFTDGGITFEGAAAPETCPCGRFLRIFDPCFGNQLGFIGMGIRPLVGSIPTVSEIQARLFAAIVSGAKDLPPTDVMMARTAEDKRLSFKEFGTYNTNAESSSNGWKSVTNWIPYMDTIAREVGCEPSNWWLIFKPLLAFKIICGPMTVMHYRLRGPGAAPKMARNVIKNLPIGTRVYDLMFYTGVHWTLALFKWPRILLNPGSYDLINTTKLYIPKTHAAGKKDM